MLILLMVIGGFWGAATGSYLGCAAWRIPRRIPIWQGRSLCPSCGADVPGYRNIPVVSFLLQRGKTKCCGNKLARRYLVAEVSSTLVGAGVMALLWLWLEEAAILGLMVLAIVALLVPLLISLFTADRSRKVGPTIETSSTEVD